MERNRTSVGGREESRDKARRIGVSNGETVRVNEKKERRSDKVCYRFCQQRVGVVELTTLLYRDTADRHKKTTTGERWSQRD